MHIGIDVSSAVNQRAGIGRYTRQLVKNLLRPDSEDYFSLFTFYGDEKGFSQDVGSAEKVEFKSKHYPGRFFRFMLFALYATGLSPDFLVSPLDLFHSPDHVFPACKKIPTVLTIHDLAFLIYPENYTRINRRYLMAMIPKSVRNARKIITDADNTKKDLVRLLKVPEEKIHVIHPGIESRFRPMSKDNGTEIRARYYVPNDFYLLYVGTLEPRKNLANLIKAYYEIKNNKGIQHKLVICGAAGWLYQKLFKLVVELDLQNDIVFTGHIPDEHLPAVYSRAELLIYPSIYEGFGLPPLEAMACGIPVICSNTSSLPEVVGDAAILIDPYNIEKIAEAMIRVISDEDLKSELKEKGLKRAKAFTWEKTAEETLKVYREAVT